jgi:hypothetical protein
MKSSNPKATNTPPTPPSNAIWGLFTLSESQITGTNFPVFEGLNPTSIQNAIDSNCTHFAVVNASKTFKTPPNLTNITATEPRAWAISDYKQAHFIKRLLLVNQVGHIYLSHYPYTLHFSVL